MTDNYLNLVELFACIARKYPERTAIRDCKTSFTYDGLYSRAAYAACVLRGKNIGTGDRIVCISRKDTGSIICFWGILMCGGIPVMLDQEDGVAVNEAKIREVMPRAIISDNQSQTLTTNLATVDFRELIHTGLPGTAMDNTLPEVTIPDTCYILLTSGTTGKPKAVQVSHKSVLHYTQAVYDRIGKPEKAHAAHVSTFSADLGLTNFFVALVSGGMLRIVNKVESTDPALFNGIVTADEISLLKITPSHLASLISNGETPFGRTIDNILLGGEKLSWESVKYILSSGICANLYNHYGPTETTVGATVFKVDASSAHFDATASVPIGSALGSGVCFLDNEKDHTGELYIGGPGVSIGYLNNDTETSKRFVEKEINGGIFRCYRTGDICKRLDDGNFEFLYRTDRQVKVNGYRIELGEVEVAIAAHSGVENVAVMLSGNNGHSVLEAYIKPVKEQELNKEMLRRFLLTILPAYKIPGSFFFYKEAPYNANGKIDLNALKKMFRTDEDHQPLKSDVPEEAHWPALAEVLWKKVLNIRSITDTDNFFEIGGDSLLAIQLIGKMQRYGYKVHITDLNNNPVFRDFVAKEPLRIFNNEKVQAKHQPKNRLTFSQHKFLHHKKFNLNRYCQAVLLETEDNICTREMTLALHAVLESHLQLTAAFRGKADTGGRKAGSGWEVGTTVLNRRMPVAYQIQEVTERLLNDISIAGGRLFAAHIFIDPDDKDFLYLACHHLVVDVISWNIIIDELLDYYEQLLKGEFTPVPAENTVNQFFNELSTAKPAPGFPDEMAAHKLHRLPRAYRKAGETDTGICNIVLPVTISRDLKYLDEQQQPSALVGFLLNAFGKALLRECGLPEITVDVEFHGRPQHQVLPDLSRSVAWWATTFPVNIELDKLSPKYCAELIEGKAAVANNINLNYREFEAMTGDNADVLFNYLGRFPAQFGNASLRLRPSNFNPGPTRSKNAFQEYKLSFTSRFIGELMMMDVQYLKSVFTKEGIESIVNSFFHILQYQLHTPGHSTIALQESNLPSAGQPLHNLGFNFRNPATAAKCIFLTGVTGFLGIHILHELIRYDHVQVYCLIRAENKVQAEGRLEDCYRHYFGSFSAGTRSRIHVVKGNLLSDKLGMDAASYDNVVNETDLVLHAAADINLLKDYSELIETNIMATRRIIELACTGKKKAVHYISTLAVSGCSPDANHRDFSEDHLEQGQVFMSSYEKTKFEAEKMIRSFLKNNGTGKIYRVGHIAADADHGRFQRNIDQNRIFQIIKGTMLLKEVPDNYCEEISFSYVDIVARGIAGICVDNIITSMSCLHLENSQYLPFSQIVAMLRQIGYDIKMVEMNRFRASLLNFNGSRNDKRAIDLMESWIQRSLDFPRRINYIQRNSLNVLSAHGLYFPRVSTEWFSNMIQEGIKAGYFVSPLMTDRPVPLLVNN